MPRSAACRRWRRFPSFGSPWTSMAAVPEPLDLLRCPVCHGRLNADAAGLRCLGGGHSFERRDGCIGFDPTVDVGKYDPAYAARYAFLWSYGYETWHNGLVESLYRSVSALVGDALSACRSDGPVI